MRKTLIFLLLLPLLVVVAGYIHGKMREGIVVRVVTASTGEITSRLTATGKVISVQETALSPSGSGRIVALLATEGQSVGKGQLLALQDDAEDREHLVSFQAALNKSSDKRGHLYGNLEALRQVYAVGGIALQSVKDAEVEFREADASLRQAASEVNQVQLSLEHKKIRAPFPGVVTRRWLNIGEWGSPTTPIFTLTQPKERELDVMVDEFDEGVIATGQEVEVTCDAFPDKVRHERVLRVDPAVRKEGNANTVSVHVSLGSDAPRLRFGQHVNAKINLARRSNIVRLPFDALITRDGRKFVAVAQRGHVHLKPVTTGIEDATQVEILNGARVGEEFILPERKNLKEGDRIRELVRDHRP